MPQTQQRDESAIIVPVRLSYQRLWDVLTSAIEVGSNYWIDHIVVENDGEGPIVGIRLDLHRPDLMEERGWTFRQDVPFRIGGTLRVVSDDATSGQVTLETLTKAALIMSEKYPHHFHDIVNENDDADTGDALLQLAVFGEMIYG